MEPEIPRPAKRSFQDAGLSDSSEEWLSRSLRKNFRPEEKPFACGQCGRAFTLKGNLTKHQRLHTNEKPYSCEITGCGKNFTQAVGLRRHIMTHNNEKPYACPAKGCSKAFVLVGNLNVHARIHTGEKPFVCSFESCDKSFAQKGNLTTHMLYHTTEKPFICQVHDCGQTFTLKGNFKKHAKTHEENVGAQNTQTVDTFYDNHASFQPQGQNPNDQWVPQQRWQAADVGYMDGGYQPLPPGLTAAQQQYMVQMQQQLQLQQQQQLQYFLNLNMQQLQQQQQQNQNNQHYQEQPQQNYYNMQNDNTTFQYSVYQEVDPFSSPETVLY